MKEITVNPIGIIHYGRDGAVLELDKKYIPALRELDGFSYINVLWWCHGCDTDEERSIIQADAPYKKGPDVIGVFATRSERRPNPIALTAAPVIRIDHDAGTIQLAYIDAVDGTPVLDVKPYTPSIDRVEEPTVPGWCSHWPKSAEQSGYFDWAAEFNF